MNEQELQKFITSCEVYKTRIEKLEKIADRHEERLQKLEIENSNTNLQFKQIMETLDEIKNKTIPSLIAEIQAIKDKPAKRYDNIISSVIGAGVGGIIGFIISKIFS